jgi:hypothetical protein
MIAVIAVFKNPGTSPSYLFESSRISGMKAVKANSPIVDVGHSLVKQKLDKTSSPQAACMNT